MYEVIFLFVLAFIWILFASLQDLKHREVANWISFSLIIFALAFRLFYCLFSDSGDWGFFYQGLIGLGIFFILGNIFYYSRIFAGGDAKLMIALGTILPIYPIFYDNLVFYAIFFLIFLFIGSFYGIAWSIGLSVKNFKELKKEFKKKIRKERKVSYFFIILGIIILVLGIIDSLFYVFGLLVLLVPFILVYAKAVEEVCMIKEVSTKELEEGDWLYEDVKLKGRVIKANWEGLSLEEIKFIRKEHRNIKIKQGIPFVPVFLISFVILVYFYFFISSAFY